MVGKSNIHLFRAILLNAIGADATPRHAMLTSNYHLSTSTLSISARAIGGSRRGVICALVAASDAPSHKWLDKPSGFHLCFFLAPCIFTFLLSFFSLCFLLLVVSIFFLHSISPFFIELYLIIRSFFLAIFLLFLVDECLAKPRYSAPPCNEISPIHFLVP